MRLIKNWPYLIIGLLSLTPVVWFIGKKDILINGLDTNFPLDPLVWITRRFYVWNDVVNAGSDFSSSTAGIVFHFIQVVPYLMGLGLQTVQLFSFLFWFSATVLAAYFMARAFLENRFSQLLFTIIYSFNTYLFNTWENIKVSNLALVITLPLILGLLIRYNSNESPRTNSPRFLNPNSFFSPPLRFGLAFIRGLIVHGLSTRENNWSVWRLFSYVALISILSTGSGINPAYFVTILVVVLIYGLVMSLVAHTKAAMLRIWKGVLVSGGSLVLVNSFWILPLGHLLFFTKKVSNLADIGFTDWLKSLSENTSLLNIIRLQGAWDWYAFNDIGAPLYIPYALNYLTKWPFIAFSFLVPMITLISMILVYRPKKQFYSFFGVLLVLGIFLGVGSHDPTGVFYNFLAQKIPFFSLFRSPWYIFTPILIIALAGLSALFVEKVAHTRISQRLLVSVYGVLVVGYLIYNYPLITGKIFRPNSDGFYVQFPDYVFASKEWLAHQTFPNRIITYPDDQLERFSWGYKGTESILGLFSAKEYFAPSFNFSNDVVQGLMDQFYLLMKKQEYNSAVKILPFLGVDSIFSKRDVAGSLSRVLDDREESFRKLVTSQTIGQWGFGQFNNLEHVSKIYCAKSKYLNYALGSSLGVVASVIPSEAVVFSNPLDQVVKDLSIVAQSHEISEAFRVDPRGDVGSSTVDYEVIINKAGQFGLVLEKKGLNQASDSKIFVDNIEVGVKPDNTSDSLFSYEPISLKTGRHQIKVIYPLSQNIINYSSANPPLVYSTSVSDGGGGDNRPEQVIFNQDVYERRITFQTINFDPYLNYNLALDFRYYYGFVPLVSLVQTAPNARVKTSIISLESLMDWDRKSLVFNPVQTSSRLQVSILMPANKPNSKSKSAIKEIVLKRIYDNRLFLVESSISHQEGLTPTIKYTKISPVEYQVEALNTGRDFYLVFLESYSPDWVIESEDLGLRSIHFMANGYANGWYIPGNAANYHFKIYYKNQDFYKIGVAISILTLLVCFSYLGIRRFKRED